jgi:hypothetical protein
MTANRATAAVHAPARQSIWRFGESSIKANCHQPRRPSPTIKGCNRRSDHLAAKRAIVDGSNPISGSRKNAIGKMK